MQVHLIKYTRKGSPINNTRVVLYRDTRIHAEKHALMCAVRLIHAAYAQANALRYEFFLQGLLQVHQASNALRNQTRNCI